MAAEEEAGPGRTLDVAEKVQSVLVAEVVEGHLCLMEAVGVERLHVLELVERLGALAVTGQGWEVGGRNGHVEAVGLGQTDWSLAEEAGALVFQVEAEEVHQLQGNGRSALQCVPISRRVR